MNETVDQTEHRCLLIATLGNVTIGCVALVFHFLTASQAILLDGLFNVSYFLTGLFTLKVAQLVRQGDDARFPFGYAFLEPLVNGIKGLLVLGISAVALVGALDALLAGGRPIAAGLAIAYGVFAVFGCWGLAIYTRVGLTRTGSPLIRADAENWIVNAAISSTVLLAFVTVPLLKRTSLAYLAPYVDPTLVLVVVVISISIPVRMAWQALMELLNRAPEPAVVDEVRRIVAKCTAELPVQHSYVRLIQPGRTRMVVVHLVLPGDYRFDGLPTLDAVRARMQAALREVHPSTYLDLIFTADPAWGAPEGFSDGELLDR